MHQEEICVRQGSDTAVLLIHGITGTPDHFQGLLPVIPEDWSVYNLLLDGHGGTVKDFSRTSMEQWKRQVNARLDEILVNHRRILIIAHSMGTLFSIQAAIDRPDAVGALFLLGCPLRVQMPPKTIFLCTRTAMGAKDPAAVNMRKDCSIALSPKLWQYVGWLPRFWELLVECRRIRRLLPRLHTPTLCFQSRLDELVSLRSCKSLRENSAVRTEILEESGHFSYTPGDLQRLKKQLSELIRRCY